MSDWVQKYVETLEIEDRSSEQIQTTISFYSDEKDIQEVLDEVALIPNLDQQQWAKTVKWLSDDLEQLAVMRGLPIQKKKAYILAFISWMLFSSLTSSFYLISLIIVR